MRGSIRTKIIPQTLKRTILAGVALGLIPFAGSNALAQSNAILEEIVVTATKREEALQDVPISVATMSGERLNSIFTGGEDVLALANRVPGLYAESSNGRAAPRFYLRGLGNIDFDLAASQPVSFIMDEVVMENTVLKSFRNHSRPARDALRPQYDCRHYQGQFAATRAREQRLYLGIPGNLHDRQSRSRVRRQPVRQHGGTRFIPVPHPGQLDQ
jgi:hypothetical protein